MVIHLEMRLHTGTNAASLTALHESRHYPRQLVLLNPQAQMKMAYAGRLDGIYPSSTWSSASGFGPHLYQAHLP